jgi:hypothetical protein
MFLSFALATFVYGDALKSKRQRDSCSGHWCPEPESNRYAGFTQATDFKSVVSTNFTTRAGVWRCVPESNWADRICNPGHNRFANAP